MISLIIPFYKDQNRLFRTLEMLENFDSNLKVKEVIFVHNGRSITGQLTKDAIRKRGFTLIHVDEVGIGAGYKAGIQQASQDWVLLSASDLPFADSDLKSFHRQNPILDCLYIGSKSKEQEGGKYIPLKRKLISSIFYLIRLVLFPSVAVKDTQGTIFISREKAISQIPILDDDYFFSFRLIYLLSKAGMDIKELEVQFVESPYKTNMNALKTGMIFLVKLIFMRIKDPTPLDPKEQHPK